jgi:serine/threonine-protein kinase
MTNYELLERIGVGGMAEVWRGRATAVGGFEKPVAIKRILPHLVEDPRFVRLLIAEAKLLANLRQRNIVQVYDVGVGDDGGFFVVLEYVDGKDIAALCERVELARERFPRDLALHVAAEVCDALDHAHSAEDEHGQRLGLVHRDVSPSNVLVSRAGEIKLTDFGIAKPTAQQQSVVGSIVGKLAYMSPEQARGESVGPASDVYALGIVLWELLLGRPMYGANVDLRVIDRVRKAAVPRPREIDPSFPRGLEDIVLSALALHPRDRFRSAGDFGAALRDYRYTTSSVDDPARELARLLARHFDEQPRRRNDEPSQVVRILTKLDVDLDAIPEAAARRSDLSGPTVHDKGLGKPRGMGFFDEPTRAAPDLAYRLAADEATQATASDPPPPRRSPPQLRDIHEADGPGPDDLPTAATASALELATMPLRVALLSPPASARPPVATPTGTALARPVRGRSILTSVLLALALLLAAGAGWWFLLRR